MPKTTKSRRPTVGDTTTTPEGITFEKLALAPMAGAESNTYGSLAIVHGLPGEDEGVPCAVLVMRTDDIPEGWGVGEPTKKGDKLRTDNTYARVSAPTLVDPVRAPGLRVTCSAAENPQLAQKQRRVIRRPKAQRTPASVRF